MTVTRAGTGAGRPADAQLKFDELGTPLRDVTFVVFDLETTGGSSAEDAVTEIGAVKVRGGEVLGEFATLVDPGRGIPPQVVALTGITELMVTGAPPMTEVLPAFLEFASGSVLVAHNSGFDVGFMKAACKRHGYRWPRPPVVCTVKLARRVLTENEAPSARLSALAVLFKASTQPNHRALDDARATVDVLHGLLERVGSVGVQSLEELLDYVPEVTTAQRRKRTMAARPAERSRRVPVPRAVGGGAVRRHGDRPETPGTPVLHGQRNPAAAARDGRLRGPGGPRHVRAPAGGVRCANCG